MIKGCKIDILPTFNQRVCGGAKNIVIACVFAFDQYEVYFETDSKINAKCCKNHLSKNTINPSPHAYISPHLILTQHHQTQIPTKRLPPNKTQLFNSRHPCPLSTLNLPKPPAKSHSLPQPGSTKKPNRPTTAFPYYVTVYNMISK